VKCGAGADLSAAMPDEICIFMRIFIGSIGFAHAADPRPSCTRRLVLNFSARKESGPRRFILLMQT
jgi:hypothetical protein